MRSSIVIAAVLGFAAVAWIASGQFGAANRATETDAAPGAAPPQEAPLVSVRVRTVNAELHDRLVVVNGRTEESRKATLRAETAGPISEVSVEEGAAVAPGQVIARQTLDDREALLREAKALVTQREIEYRAAVELSKKGFRSDTKLAEARALLDAARARTESMAIDLSRTDIRAPFEGVLETRSVERGDYVKVGDSVAVIFDLDPLLAVGFVSERDVAAISPGAPGRVRLVDGTMLDGSVTYIASVADAETRAFRIELQVPNPGNRIRAGLTGELRLPLEPIRAHLISPATLTLADDGRIGVRIVDDSDIVAFVPVSILSDSSEGYWVTGIADGARLITVGHEYVKAGQKVRAVAETPETAS